MKSYSSYRGYNIYWKTSNLINQLVCYAPGIAGVWNSEHALCDYIDFVIKTRKL